ncbi:MAG: N-acetyl-gamma-glutamyl-phosphate reductase [Ignavibacteriaceae bacterium]|jgi:N-acetyl-gamma-glutamyl-phosphate/LysW-gamma-L-alpha-aminoadipyl-6-phosphate reductase|nr:N-acetyl-gamma-glutamyl-phosphate reductase [Ignavibacteriaceae bacterium]
MNKIKVSIAGGSGYTGGELLRLLLFHPNIEVAQVTSEANVGKFVYKIHPNLRKSTQLKFSSINELEKCDLLFLCLPHGSSMNRIDEFKNIAERIIDLSGDFRLKDKEEFKKWYHHEHSNPEMLNEFIYGIPELHREEMKNAKLISSAGCNATTSILALYPLYKEGLIEADRTVIEVKVGSSEGGNKFSESSHHPERSGSVRSYMPVQHRHTAEIIQELSFGKKIEVHFSATSIDMVRGILATCHVFTKQPLEEKDLWKLYRKYYNDEPFIRIVKENEGIYRYPEPKLLIGTNYCDIGFKKDEFSNRFVIIASIDNLMKGAAGQALQAFNLMYGFNETTGLDFPGFHPI